MFTIYTQHAGNREEFQQCNRFTVIWGEAKIFIDDINSCLHMSDKAILHILVTDEAGREVFSANQEAFHANK